MIEVQPGLRRILAGAEPPGEVRRALRAALGLLAFVALWCGLSAPTPAAAAQVKFGIFVGNDEGAPGDPELVFAEADAEKMRELFVELGGFRPGAAALLKGTSARAVQNEFERMTDDIKAAIQDGHEAMFVFYYSGHGDSDSLHLGSSKIEHENLRHWLERTGAQIRIAMVDACQSGALVRRKGGQRGGSFAFAEPTVESAHGTAIITSSAASELSQESVEIGGGFFTHYLHTALSGGADRNRDGEVTLSEAYAYVHTETSFRTKETPETQTPSREFDVSGAGEIVLTLLEEASSRITFLGDLEGTYVVWDESRKRHIAQVSGDRPVGLAVRPGTYYVHQRMPGWVDEARYSVRRGESHSVLAEDFETVSYREVASRGDLEKMVRRSKLPDLSLRFLLGFRGFGGAAKDYFGTQATGGVSARFLGQGRQYGSFHVMSGAAAYPIEIAGLPPIASQQTASSLGGTIGFATKPRTMRAGLGARSSLNLLTRRFPEWDAADQSRAMLGVGVDMWAGLHTGRFSADLQFDWQLLVAKWEDSQGWPTCADLTLALGYRF